MTCSWSIRTFRSADAGTLALLHAEAMAGIGDVGWSSADIATIAGTPGIHGLVAELVMADVRERLGFLLVRTVADEAEILTLAVRLAARRRGIATGLLDGAAALATARGARRIFLEVAVDNAAGLQLYERAGYRQTGLRQGYYDRGQGLTVDAFVLGRSLEVTVA